MLVLVIILFSLLIVAILIGIGVFGRKYLKKLPNRGQVKVLSAIGGLSEFLLLVFGVMGSSYIQQYQNWSGSCPSYLPYVTAILITGSIGFVCILLASYQAYAWQKRNSHLLLIATNIAIVVTIFVALFFADFCIA
jgi:hypothetical protein